VADEKPKESRPVGAPRLDQGGQDLDSRPQEKSCEEAQPKEISREISALFAVAEAARRVGLAHEALCRLSEASTPIEMDGILENARASLWGVLDLIDFEGDDDDD
jgi:hypothetical protein